MQCCISLLCKATVKPGDVDGCDTLVSLIFKEGVYIRCVHVCSVSLQACPTVAHQAPLSMEFSRQEYWSRLPRPPPGDLPDPRMEQASLASPELAGRFFTTAPPAQCRHFSKHRLPGVSYILLLMHNKMSIRLQRNHLKCWLKKCGFPSSALLPASCPTFLLDFIDLGRAWQSAY